MRNVLLFALTTALAACSSDPAPTPADAATPDDQATVDAADVTTTDVTTPDVTTPDVTTTDVTTPDATTDRPDVTAPDVAVDAPTTDAPATDAPPTDAPATDAAQDAGCPRPDVMVLPERIDCGRGGGVCPAGYECLSFSGVVLQQYCGRSCRSDCDCPTTQRCGSYTDKAGTHPLCVASVM